MEEKNAQYFACIDESNKVTSVIVCSSEEIVNFPGTWIETFRDKPGKKYAGPGDTYEKEYDDFFPSLEWVPDLETIKQWGYPAPFEHLRPTE